MPQWEYDLALVGLGPAGATLARLTAGRMRVFALSRPTGEHGFCKPCGGLLSLDAQKALSRFDLTLPKDILVDPQIFSVRTIDLGSGLIRHYQRFYINLDRAKFDGWLVSLIPPEATRAAGVCRGVTRLPGGGFALEYSDDTGVHTVTARYLAGADGADSAVRRALFPEKRFRRYLSIQQWFREEHCTPFYSCIFDPDTSDCCSWSISKDNCFIFGGAFAPQGCRAAFERQKRRLAERCGFRFGEPLRTEACVVLRPKTPADFFTGAGDAFLLGEAAGFISPSSLEGISWAIDSARLLEQALRAPGDAAAVYRRLTRGIRLRLLLKRLKCPFLYWPPLRRLVMQSGLKTIDVIGAPERAARKGKE